jgi:glutamate racemase
MTHSGHIGVMATKGTFSGLPYRRVTERFASNIRVTECHCPDLIALAEAGMNTYEYLSSVMERELGWLLASDIDTLVLGCTHFSLIRSSLETFVGSHVRLFDPAEAVARQIIRCLQANGLTRVPDPATGCRDLFCTTGDAYQFALGAQRIVTDQPRIVWNAWWDNQ